jgi:predicted amidohydrolase YtcJ
VDPSFSIHSAVAIKDGKILAVGGPEVATRLQAAQRIDLHGRTLMPAFIDTHVHLFCLSHRQIEPGKAQSIGKLKAMVASKATLFGPNEWITGYGWDEAHFAEKRVPNRRDMDEAAPHNPVVLIRAGSHSVVGTARPSNWPGSPRQRTSRREESSSATRRALPARSFASGMIS